MSRGKPLSFNRNEVLGRAMELFWKRGYAQTGMTELLDHMGIQRQSFYNTFGSKEDVFLEAIRMYSHEMIGEVKKILQKDRHPRENLQDIFTTWKERESSQKGCGCLVGNSIAEFGLSKETVGILLKEQVDEMHQAFHHSFDAAIKKGYLSDQKDPKALAAGVVAMTQGLALLSKLDVSKEMLEDIMSVIDNLFQD